MKKFILTLALIMGIGIGSIFITSVANASEENTATENVQAQARLSNSCWYEDGYSNWYFFKDGEFLRNDWLYYGGNWYYFNDIGIMVSNKVERIGDKVYLFSENGAMTTKCGWISVYNNLYEFYTWYYGNGDGTVKVGEWIYDNGAWYYLKGLNAHVHAYGYVYGSMAKGTEEINGKTYLFDSNGRMEYRSGWIECGNNDYIFGNGDGTVKSSEWFYYNGKWYYFMRQVATYRDPYKGGFYSYFGGQMLRNVSETIDGKLYTFDYNGACINP